MARNRRAGGRIILGVVCLAVGFGCLHTPLGWSPDGRWLAYVTEAPPADLNLKPGWLFRNDGPGIWERPRGAARSYQLWVSRFDNSASILIEESPLPIGSPGWSPDGRSLGYVRIVERPRGQEPAGLRLEVVLREGLERKRVVHSHPMKELPPEADRLPGQAVVWSPDGHHLALPQVDPPGTLIIQAGNGRVVRFIDDAFLPAWSGDGGKLAYFVRGESDQLTVSEVNGGIPRTLLDVGQAGQAPVWTRDSSGLLAMVHKTNRQGDRPPTERLELVRVQVETGMVDSIRSLSTESSPVRQRPVQGTSFAIDRDGENLFHTIAVEGQPRQLAWYQVRDGVPYKNFAPIDMNMTMGSLSVSPDGGHLAFRVGEPEFRLPPVVLDLHAGNTATFLVPDDQARMAWIGFLAHHANRLLQTSWLTADRNAPVARPIRLPVRGEVAENSELSLRLRRLGRLGRPLCNRPADAPPLDAAQDRMLAEARLFFDMLREDYPSAGFSLDRLENLVESRQQRRALLGVRAQILLGEGEMDAAERTIRYLRDTSRSGTYRVEETSRGTVLVPDLSNEINWTNYLQAKVARVREMIRHETPVDTTPLGHRNPDAPQPGLGLDLNVAPVEEGLIPRILPRP